MLALLRVERPGIDLPLLDMHREGLSRRLLEMAPGVIAMRDALAAAVRAGPPAGLLPLAAAGADLRSALARSLAAECLLRIDPNHPTLRAALRADRMMALAHARLANGPRPATVAMALQARGSSLMEMIERGLAAAAPVDLSATELAFYGQRRGPAVAASPPSGEAGAAPDGESTAATSEAVAAPPSPSPSPPRGFSVRGAAGGGSGLDDSGSDGTGDSEVGSGDGSDLDGSSYEDPDGREVYIGRMSTARGCARAVVGLGDRLDGVEDRLNEVIDSMDAHHDVSITLQDTVDELSLRVASLEHALHARATTP